MIILIFSNYELYTTLCPIPEISEQCHYKHVNQSQHSRTVTPCMFNVYQTTCLALKGSVNWKGEKHWCDIYTAHTRVFKIGSSGCEEGKQANRVI